MLGHSPYRNVDGSFGISVVMNVDSRQIAVVWQRLIINCMLHLFLGLALCLKVCEWQGDRCFRLQLDVKPSHK